LLRLSTRMAMSVMGGRLAANFANWANFLTNS